MIFQSLIGQIVASADNPHRAPKSRAATLISEIEHQPGISTAELARGCGLHSSLVWGILKHSVQTGQVEHSRKTGWRMSSAREDRKAAEAAAFLRQRGWSCEPPAKVRQ